MTRLSEDKCLKRLKKYSDYNENSYGININYKLNSTELINRDFFRYCVNLRDGIK